MGIGSQQVLFRATASAERMRAAPGASMASSGSAGSDADSSQGVQQGGRTAKAVRREGGNKKPRSVGHVILVLAAALPRRRRRQRKLHRRHRRVHARALLRRRALSDGRWEGRGGGGGGGCGRGGGGPRRRGGLGDGVRFLVLLDGRQHLADLLEYLELVVVRLPPRGKVLVLLLRVCGRWVSEKR